MRNIESDPVVRGKMAALSRALPALGIAAAVASSLGCSSPGESSSTASTRGSGEATATSGVTSGDPSGMGGEGGALGAGGARGDGGAPGTGGALGEGGAPSASAAQSSATATSGGGGSSAASSASSSSASSSSSTGGATSSAAAGGSVALDPTLLTKCTGTNPILCAFNAPNGNYDVSVEVGAAAVAASSQVAAETHHNAGPVVQTAPGVFSLQTFTVNVRQEIHDGGQSAPANVLNLAISGASPKLHGVGFKAAPSSITIFVAGDSTVCDWVPTNTSATAVDQTGWAQELSMYLKPGVAVANYADSGETASTFYSKFFGPARTAMKAGDYLFIQFGHNDQKVPADVTNYKANLMKYVTDARARKVTPVLFTPVSRSSGTAANPGFAGLDQQARDLAAEQNIALVDLTTLSRAYYTTVPNKSALFIDGTHFHEIGATGVAGVVAQALKSSSLPLKTFVK